MEPRRAVVWEAVELNSRTELGRVVVNPPSRRGEVKARRTLDTWYFCNCGKAYQNADKYWEHKKLHVTNNENEKPRRINKITIAKKDDDTYQVVTTELKDEIVTSHNVTLQPSAPIDKDETAPGILQEQPINEANHVAECHVLDREEPVVGSMSPSQLLKPEKKKKLECNKCEKTFLQIRHLKIHVSKMHGGRKMASSRRRTDTRKIPVGGTVISARPQMACGICKKRLGSKAAYFKHMLFKHDGFSLVRCELCPYMTGIPDLLSLHLKRMHSKKSNLTNVSTRRKSLEVVEESGNIIDKPVGPPIDAQVNPASQSTTANSSRTRLSKSKILESAKVAKVEDDPMAQEPVKDENLDQKNDVILAALTTSRLLRRIRQDFFKCDQCSRLFRFASQLRYHKEKSHRVSSSTKVKAINRTRATKMVTQAVGEVGNNNEEIKKVAPVPVRASLGRRAKTPAPVKILEKAVRHRSQTQKLEIILKVATLASANVMMRNVYNRTRRRRLSCPVCQKAIKTKSALRNHIMWIHRKGKDRNGTLQGPTNPPPSPSRRGYNTRKSAAPNSITKRRIPRRSQTAIQETDKRMEADERLPNPEKSEVELRKSLRLAPAISSRNRISTSLKCPHCTMVFRTASSLLVHKMTHKANFTCGKCGSQFQTKFLFERHAKKAHVTSGKFPCDRCPCVYRTLLGLISHTFHHHNITPGTTLSTTPPRKSSEQVVTTSTTSKEGSTPENKEALEPTPSPEIPETIPSPPPCESPHLPSPVVTSKESPPPISLISSEVTDDGQNSEKCNFCGIQLGSLRNKQRHLKSAHSGGTFVCELCLCTFHSARGLFSHKLRVHKRKRPTLFRKERQQDELNVVLKESGSPAAETPMSKPVPKLSPIRSLICSTCKMTVSGGVRGMLQHKKEAHGSSEGFKCTFCTISFRDRRSLVHHLATCPQTSTVGSEKNSFRTSRSINGLKLPNADGMNKKFEENQMDPPEIQTQVTTISKIASDPLMNEPLPQHGIPTSVRQKKIPARNSPRIITKDSDGGSGVPKIINFYSQNPRFLQKQSSFNSARKDEPSDKDDPANIGSLTISKKLEKKSYVELTGRSLLAVKKGILRRTCNPKEERSSVEASGTTSAKAQAENVPMNPQSFSENWTSIKRSGQHASTGSPAVVNCGIVVPKKPLLPPPPLLVLEKTTDFQLPSDALESAVGQGLTSLTPKLDLLSTRIPNIGEITITKFTPPTATQNNAISSCNPSMSSTSQLNGKEPVVIPNKVFDSKFRFSTTLGHLGTLSGSLKANGSDPNKFNSQSADSTVKAFDRGIRDLISEITKNPEISIFPVTNSPDGVGLQEQEQQGPTNAGNNLHIFSLNGTGRQKLTPPFGSGSNNSKTRLAICQLCKKNYSGRDWIAHRKVCQGQLQQSSIMKCGYCGKNFSKEALIAHMKVCGGGNVLANGKSFSKR